jgi:hypothetical protein
MKKNTAKKAKTAMKVGAGVLTMAALVGAATYVLSDKKRTAKAKTWAVKARKEVTKNVKIAKRIGEKEYAHMVDVATKRYGSLENVNAAELVKVARDMKAEWTRIQAEAKKMGKKKAAPKRKRASR